MRFLYSVTSIHKYAVYTSLLVTNPADIHTLQNGTMSTNLMVHPTLHLTLLHHLLHFHHTTPDHHHLLSFHHAPPPIYLRLQFLHSTLQCHLLSSHPGPLVKSHCQWSPVDGHWTHNTIVVIVVIVLYCI